MNWGFPSFLRFLLVFVFPPFGVVVSFEVGGIFKGGIKS